ncbi:hypothetical protein KP509_02G076100 [Ceratopteris richardii]|uniref:Uncharacterized protein n=1 Tax=Ceratopteris richardii TaxID=49495 RepID=A0A8T2VF45_CERRI|nr:hypothetical protein KP509_02G076100 [Ceratopteris richardii]KAH7444373.1 hypothetical protein KP509_02G076100 [Ceratopteris richardii]
MIESTPGPSPTGGGLFSGFSRLCKGLATLLVLVYIVILIFPPAVDYIALVPGKTIPFAWNLLSAGYLEQSIFTLLVSVLGILFGGKVLEPIWGSREFFKFVVLVNFWTLVSTFLLSITLYFISRQETYLYKPLSGFHGVLAGFLVSVKQLMPDQEVTVLKLRAKWVPSIFVLFTTLLGVLAVNAMSFLPFVIFGTYSSWIYLRFYQRHADSSHKGDLSGEFAFVTFFPELLRPIVSPICLLCGKIFCGRTTRSEPENSGHVLGGVPLPGSDDFDASRRRERGARALEERLNFAMKSDSGVTKPAEENV